MENNNYSTRSNSVYEDKANPAEQSVNIRLEADIQVAYLNMLHEKGLLTDSIHSIALGKAMRGVV